MTKTRREFTTEFKREAVALLESSVRSQIQIAAELGNQPSMLRQGRTVLMRSPLPPRPAELPTAASASPVAPPSDQTAKIARLWRGLDQTRLERDMLKSDRNSCEDAQVTFALIEQHASTWPVRLIRRVL